MRGLPIKAAWHTSNRVYLKIMGITTYVSFEQYARRLKQWEYLNRLSRPNRASRYDPNHYTYLFSKAEIDKLVNLGVLLEGEVIRIKKVISKTTHY